MRYSRFLAYNVFGGVLWVGLFIFAGYLFGNIPVVRRNFTAVIMGIIVVSVLPIVFEWVKQRRAASGRQGT
jgi:membrane-associated protein